MTDSPAVVTHELHERLTAVSDPTAVNHHPMCAAHPAVNDGPCGCDAAVLARLIATVIADHHPVEGFGLDSRQCPDHNPRDNPDFVKAINREVAEACPTCTVNRFLSCASWDHHADYPCKTVTMLATALGWDPTPTLEEFA